MMSKSVMQIDRWRMLWSISFRRWALRMDQFCWRLPSAWCLCGQVKGTPRDRHEALLYQLEDRLPIAAEDILADFLAMDPDRSFGVAVERHRIVPILEALNQAGIRCVAAVPSAMLSLQAAAPEPSQTHHIMADGSDYLDALILASGRPTGWARLTATSSALQQWLKIAPPSGEAPSQIAVTGVDPKWIPDDMDGVVDVPDLLDQAAALGHEIVSGKCKPWFNLSRRMHDAEPWAPVRAPLLAAAVALVCLVAVFIGMMLYRASAYDQLAQDAYNALRQPYKKALPDQRLPGSLAVMHQKLAEEAKRRRAMRGEAEDMPDQRSALSTTLQVFMALPTDRHFRVLEWSVEPDRFDLEGQARLHSDAEAIGAALRRTEQFEIDPAKTQALKGQGVSFILSGRPKTPQSVAGGAP